MFSPYTLILVDGLVGYENSAKNAFPLFVFCLSNHVPKRGLPSYFSCRGLSLAPRVVGRGELYLFNMAGTDVTD